MFILKRRFFIAFILSAVIVSGCFADYIHDIPVETIAGMLMTSPSYEKPYKYDISFSNLEMNITLKLHRRGLDPASPLVQFWETSIENIWNHKFDIFDKKARYHYHINFDAVFYSDESSEYHMLDWTVGLSGREAAHEAGHLIGLYDEYDGPFINPSNPIYDSTSIMSDIGYNVYHRHYEAFLDWLLLQPAAADRQLSLVTYDPDWVNPPIPEPATVFLFGLGLLLYRKNAKR
jgi:hypothetical protein